jgi:biotin carboxyl carrier protein
MTYTVKINNKEYEVEVERGKAILIKTTEIKAPAPAAAPVTPVAVLAPVPSTAAVVSAGEEAVKAPMPGTILNIKAVLGKSVKKGEVLLILEAMKMENEIVAPKDGVIANVFTTKGASVATGDALVSIK